MPLPIILAPQAHSHRRQRRVTATGGQRACRRRNSPRRKRKRAPGSRSLRPPAPHLPQLQRSPQTPPRCGGTARRNVTMKRAIHALRMNLVVSLVLLSLGLPLQAWAGFDEGIAAYERGDYTTAVQELLPLAQAG